MFSYKYVLLGLIAVGAAGLAGWSAGMTAGVERGIALEKSNYRFAIERLKEENPPVVGAYLEVLQHLQQDIFIPFTGNVDRDYAQLGRVLWRTLHDVCNVHGAQSTDEALKESCAQTARLSQGELQRLSGWEQTHGAKPASVGGK